MKLKELVNLTNIFSKQEINYQKTFLKSKKNFETAIIENSFLKLLIVS